MVMMGVVAHEQPRHLSATDTFFGIGGVYPVRVNYKWRATWIVNILGVVIGDDSNDPLTRSVVNTFVGVDTSIRGDNNPGIRVNRCDVVNIGRHHAASAGVVRDNHVDNETHFGQRCIQYCARSNTVHVIVRPDGNWRTGNTNTV